MKRKIYLLFLLPLMSCVQETVVEQPWGTTISGKWAKIDSELQTSEYMEIGGGRCRTYTADSRHLAHMQTIWDAEERYFELQSNERYSISGGSLAMDGKAWEIRFDRDTLHVMNGKYVKVNEFSPECYSHVNLEKNDLWCSYQASDCWGRITIDRPLPWARPKLSTEDRWIHFRFEENPAGKPEMQDEFYRYEYDDMCGRLEFCFFLDENRGIDPRTGTILVEYPNAEPVTINVLQDSNSDYGFNFLNINPYGLTYTKKTVRNGYEIYNPREGVELILRTDADWITNLTAKDNEYSFDVAMNSTEEERKGRIYFTYGRVEKFVDYTQKPRPVFSGPESGSYNVGFEESGIFSSIMSVNKNGMEGNVTISKPDWVICEFTSYNVNENMISGRLNLRVKKNDTVKQRRATVNVRYPGAQSLKFSITQEGNPLMAANLAEQSTANCYIVSSGGAYRFPAVQGNRFWSVGEVASAEVLWESFGTAEIPKDGDLISSVSIYKKGSPAIIWFTTPDSYKEGNALIAAKDASGNVLWSWHVWLTDAPEDQVYNNNAGTMMDRNLGATSAVPGDVGALGLLYQWGRKDPFLGSASVSGTPSGYGASIIQASSTLTDWPKAYVTETVGTVGYATAHPTTFITTSDGSSSGNYYDWLYPSSSDYEWLRDDRWASTKSIYDPCPPGYRVPDGGEDGIWCKAYSGIYDNASYDSVNRGMNLGSGSNTVKFTDASVCWYPAVGYIDSFKGWLFDSADGRYRYWSCTSYINSSYSVSDSSHGLEFFEEGRVMPGTFFSRTEAYAVRCMKE